MGGWLSVSRRVKHQADTKLWRARVLGRVVRVAAEGWLPVATLVVAGVLPPGHRVGSAGSAYLGCG